MIHAKYPCMGMSKEACIKFTGVLSNHFEEKRITTRIIGYDHNFGEEGVKYVKTLFLSEVQCKFDGSAWHHYIDDTHPSDLEGIKEQFPHKNIYFTERTTSFFENKSIQENFYSNFWYMFNIFYDVINHGAICALGWNIALDENHGPVTKDCEFKDGSGLVNFSENGTYSYDGVCLAISIFSFLFSEGAQRLRTEFIVREEEHEENRGCYKNLKAMSFFNPRGPSITTVIRNSSKKAKQVKITLEQLDEPIRIQLEPKSVNAYRIKF